MEQLYIWAIIGYTLLFCANPIQWYRVFKRGTVGDISIAWIGLPIVARFFIGFTAQVHPIWLWGNTLILVSCMMTLVQVVWFKLRHGEVRSGPVGSGTVW